MSEKYSDLEVNDFELIGVTFYILTFLKTVI